ncbi:hypothetical protein RVR_P170 (plasmid) [Actinacidiphila reveromycinica]|uniref:Uncharacterized protein n=1 Tax=Actinacidiphila reveromycinica TaxID=659352 RepID=A0A7R6TAB9_9ACTN|nr:hypothetical protein [Streptomyces sp. SN-593]BBG20690.1 hypothetical protein RVR_P170 [Streptomyces sp. SN-593]
MTPQSNDDQHDQQAAKAAAKAAAAARLAEAKAKRDKAKQEADRAFWRAVNAEITSKVLLQKEACEAIGYEREYVRRQIKEHVQSD